MAEALGLTQTSYRVTVHRIKGNMRKFCGRLLHGEQLRLDQEHQAMVTRIDEDFNNLYPTLIFYYNACMKTLKQAEAVQSLRQQHYCATGMMLHESETRMMLTPTAFWNKLRMMLVV